MLFLGHASRRRAPHYVVWLAATLVPAFFSAGRIGSAGHQPAPKPGDLVRSTNLCNTSYFLCIVFCKLPVDDLSNRCAGSLTFDGLHYWTFPAYNFEGLPPAERAETRQQQYRSRVLSVTTASAKVRLALALR